MDGRRVGQARLDREIVQEYRDVEDVEGSGDVVGRAEGAVVDDGLPNARWELAEQEVSANGTMCLFYDSIR